MHYHILLYLLPPPSFSILLPHVNVMKTYNFKPTPFPLSHNNNESPSYNLQATISSLAPPLNGITSPQKTHWQQERRKYSRTEPIVNPIPPGAILTSRRASRASQASKRAAKLLTGPARGICDSIEIRDAVFCDWPPIRGVCEGKELRRAAGHVFQITLHE